MGCFKICFGTCNNQKVPHKHILPSLHNDKGLVRFEPLHPTKPVVQVSKSVIFQFNCRDKIDILVDRDNKKKESEIDNTRNGNVTILENEKGENVIGIDDKFLDFSLLKLEEFADVEGRNELSESLFSSLSSSKKKFKNVAENGDVLVQEESSDSLFSVSVESRKQLNGLDQLVQEESSDSLFSVSVGSKKKLNAAEKSDLLAQEESSDSLFSVSVESRKQLNGSDNVDQLVQEESSDSLYSVSVGSKKKVNAAEKGGLLVQEESSDSLFSVSVESRKQLNGLGNVDQLVQEESSDSLFSVSVGSKNKVNAAEKGDLLVQEECSDLLFSVSVELRKQVNEVKTEENEVNSPITFGLKRIGKCPNPSPTLANSVLNPIQNLTNWKKAIKATTINTCIKLKDHEKENMSSVQGLNLIPFSAEEPSLKKLNNRISKQQKGSHLKVEGSPFSVDTSLSSWLVKTGESSDNTRISSSRSTKFEDMPSLAALTCEELKQHSVTSSPRRSPSHYNSDELPIIGTVGSFWSHTGQIINSSGSNSSRGRNSTKLRKDNIVNYHFTPPFSKRLAESA